MQFFNYEGALLLSQSLIMRLIVVFFVLVFKNQKSIYIYIHIAISNAI